MNITSFTLGTKRRRCKLILGRWWWFVPYGNGRWISSWNEGFGPANTAFFWDRLNSWFRIYVCGVSLLIGPRRFKATWRRQP